MWERFEYDFLKMDNHSCRFQLVKIASKRNWRAIKIPYEPNHFSTFYRSITPLTSNNEIQTIETQQRKRHP